MDRTTVWCTAKIEGFHLWKDAPSEFDYLRNSHRHLFGFRLEMSVEHDNRSIEFIDLRNRLVEFGTGIVGGGYDYRHRPVGKSCEMLAREVLEHFEAVYSPLYISVTVDEDGENGATIVHESNT